MRIKIGILTFHRGTNYGAFLQAWSLHQILLNFGLDVSIIDYQHSAYRKAERNVFLFQNVRQLKYKHWSKPLKYYLFRFWQWRYLNMSKSGVYDLIIFGSDEIWNLNNWVGTIDLKLFGFGFENSRKIGLAPSFGSTEISTLLSNKEIISLLSQFDYISVRDTISQEYLKKAGIGSDLMLDPTMYIDWRQIKLTDKYSRKLTKRRYAIVNIHQIKIFHNDLLKLRDYLIEMHAIELICLTYTNNIVGLKCVNVPNPFEWVSYYLNAMFVITDTFHGAIFGLNSGQPLVILNPGEKGNKVKGLFQNAGLPLSFHDLNIENFSNLGELPRYPLSLPRNLSVIHEVLKIHTKQ
jgi:hypothetical protein